MKKMKLSAFLTVIGIAVALLPRPVQAGNNIAIECSNQKTCRATPEGKPLFAETAWLPGSSVTQKLTITNSSAGKGKIALRLQNYQDPSGLGRAISFAIHETSPDGKMLYTSPTLQSLRNGNFFAFDTLTPHQAKAYFLTAAMSATAGGEFQSAKLQFDTQLGLETEPAVAKKISTPKIGNSIVAEVVQPTPMLQTVPVFQENAATTHPVLENRCSLWVRYLPELILAVFICWILLLEFRFPQYSDWMIPLFSFAFLTTALSVWYFWYICVR